MREDQHAEPTSWHVSPHNQAIACGKPHCSQRVRGSVCSEAAGATCRLQFEVCAPCPGSGAARGLKQRSGPASTRTFWSAQAANSMFHTLLRPHLVTEPVVRPEEHHQSALPGDRGWPYRPHVDGDNGHSALRELLVGHRQAAQRSIRNLSGGRCFGLKITTAPASP